jgi:hypothetical protein
MGNVNLEGTPPAVISPVYQSRLKFYIRRSRDLLVSRLTFQGEAYDYEETSEFAKSSGDKTDVDVYSGDFKSSSCEDVSSYSNQRKLSFPRASCLDT